MAGSIVFVSVLVSLWVPAAVFVAGFIGAGLTFAAVSNTCTMGMLLARLPYNRGAGCDVDAAITRLRRTGAARFLPLLDWLPDYDRGALRHDVIAGLTVAVMLVPQNMAYAALAGMPPVTGLYASVVPLVVYALLGTSGSLAVGPVAITAMMPSAALGPLSQGDPAPATPRILGAPSEIRGNGGMCQESDLSSGSAGCSVTCTWRSRRTASAPT